MSESIFNPILLLDLPWSEKRQLLASQGLFTLTLGLDGTVTSVLEWIDFESDFPQKVWIGGSIMTVFECGCVNDVYHDYLCTQHGGYLMYLLVNSK